MVENSFLAPVNEPWLLIDDFNAILCAHERWEGNILNSTSCFDFSEMIVNNELQEIISNWAPFTWAKKYVRGYIECKLDRALCNSNWLNFWNKINFFTFTRHASDHNSLVCQFWESVSLGPIPFVSSPRGFNMKIFKFLERKMEFL